MACYHSYNVTSPGAACWLTGGWGMTMSNIQLGNMRPARRPWSRFWEAYISGTDSPIDKRSSLVGTPIPSTVYGTNAESYKYPLWHVARGACGVSKIFRLLFLGKGWADCAEILYAIGVPLVTAYAVVTGGISLHVRTCRDTPPTHTHTALLYLGNGSTDCV